MSVTHTYDPVCPLKSAVHNLLGSVHLKGVAPVLIFAVSSDPDARIVRSQYEQEEE
jgi:hypothetical protein